MTTVYVAISTKDNEVLGVFGSIESMQELLTPEYPDNTGWGVAPDQREAELLAPTNYQYDTYVVAHRFMVQE